MRRVLHGILSGTKGGPWSLKPVSLDNAGAVGLFWQERDRQASVQMSVVQSLRDAFEQPAKLLGNSMQASRASQSLCHNQDDFEHDLDRSINVVY
jgi:hypothetical protein